MGEESKLSDEDIERIVRRLRETLPIPVFPAVIMPPPMEWPKPPPPPYRPMYEVWCRSIAATSAPPITFTGSVA